MAIAEVQNEGQSSSGGCRGCPQQTDCLPGRVGRADRRVLERLVHPPETLTASSTLFSRGAPFRWLFMVRNGALKTWRADRSGTMQVLGFHMPGDMVGLDGLDAGHYRCSAEAMERSDVCAIPFSRLRELAIRSPELHLQVLRIISREFFKDQQHLIMMGRRQASQRLALFLCRMVERNQQHGKGEGELVLSMSRGDLANYLGLVVETVSRWFTRMQEQEVLEVRRRHILVLDQDRLKQLAGQE